MRRFTALAALLGLINLTALDARTECTRHEERAEQPVVQHHDAGHSSHHATPPADTNEPEHQSNADHPPCCILAGSCVSTAFTSVVRDVTVRVAHGASLARTDWLTPTSADRSPEPPPPRA